MRASVAFASVMSAKVPTVMADAPGVVVNGRNQQPFGVGFPALAAVPDLALPDTVIVDLLPHVAIERHVLAAAGKKARVTADGAFAREAGDLSKAALTSMMLQSASVMTMPSLQRSMMRAASRRRALGRGRSGIAGEQDAVGGSFDTGDAGSRRRSVAARHPHGVAGFPGSHGAGGFSRSASALSCATMRSLLRQAEQQRANRSGWLPADRKQDRRACSRRRSPSGVKQDDQFAREVEVACESARGRLRLLRSSG